MTELLRNAWMGWLDFTSDGKLAALFLAALIYLWLSGKWREHKRLFWYTVMTALCCILPVTAVALMLYQTRFYDYVWLWSMVPVTVAIAWAAVEMIDWLKGDLQRVYHGRPVQTSQRGETGIWEKMFPVAALLLAALVLSGGSAENTFNSAKERQERKQAWEVLAEVEERQGGNLYLWAPQEILAYVREFDSSVQLLYGRDMWDASLGAYSYDIYPGELRELYLWMENVDESGLAQVKDEERGKIILDAPDCVAAALEAGVNCILLPQFLEYQVAEELAQVSGVEFSRAGEYYLLTR